MRNTIKCYSGDPDVVTVTKAVSVEGGRAVSTNGTVILGPDEIAELIEALGGAKPVAQKDIRTLLNEVPSLADDAPTDARPMADRAKEYEAAAEAIMSFRWRDAPGGADVWAPIYVILTQAAHDARELAATPKTAAAPTLLPEVADLFDDADSRVAQGAFLIVSGGDSTDYVEYGRLVMVTADGRLADLEDGDHMPMEDWFLVFSGTLPEAQAELARIRA
jgi:hypothetical protein